MSEAVFDTNILIDALNGVGNPAAEFERFAVRSISRLTWVEVLTGAFPDDVDRAEGFLSFFTVIEVDEEIGRRAAMLRADRSGRRLLLTDAVILASAQVRRRILVTRNTKDFPANMPGIRNPYIV